MKPDPRPPHRPDARPLATDHRVGHGSGGGFDEANLFAPSDGTFNAPTAAALTRWKEE